MADVQTYPKMLYLGGQVRDERGRHVPHHQTKTVANIREEEEAKADGFLAATENFEEAAPEAAAPSPKPKRQRDRSKKPAPAAAAPRSKRRKDKTVG